MDAKAPDTTTKTPKPKESKSAKTKEVKPRTKKTKSIFKVETGVFTVVFG